MRCLTGNDVKRDGGNALGLAVSLALLSSAAEGQVFKCKDAEGNVTYTDVPCLRSEASSVVDTRANVADHSGLRREAARVQRSEATSAGQAQAPSPAPPAPPPASAPRTGGYSR